MYVMEEDEAKASKNVDSTALASTSEPRLDDDKDSLEKECSHPNDVVKKQHTVVLDPPDVLQSESLISPYPVTTETHLDTSTDRDVALARVESVKRLAFVKAWEETEKAKVENKACKKLSIVGMWEERKKATVQVQMKKVEERLERKKADYVEKMKNKMAEIHQSAEEKRAVIEAKKHEHFLKVEENAAKYRSLGDSPRKFQLLSCFKAYHS